MTDVVVMGCEFPRGLLYDVANHVWYAPRPDGAVTVGLTRVAVALADNRVFAFTPKRAGRPVERGKSCATIESSKWVGPARIAFDGTVEAVNQELIDRPDLLVTDPYGAGWMLIARPAADDALAGLVDGDRVGAAYTAWMEREDFPGCGT